MTEYLSTKDISGDGGIVKNIIKEGEGDQQPPQKGQEVTVNYEGRLEDGSVFDRSMDHGEPLKVRIGEGQVIDGWDQGIMSMLLGEKADIVIKSKYAYGDIGSPPKIPGKATLIFTIELIQIEDRRPTRWQMSDQELIQVALRQKDDGNIKFKEKKMKAAEGLYRDALAHLDTCKINNEDISKLKITLYQNLSVALNYSGDYKDTVQNCTIAIGIDEKAVKAWYLRGVAHLKMKNFDEATSDIKQAIKLNPTDKKLRQEFETLKAEKKKHSSSQSSAMQKFFSEGIYKEKDGAIVAKNHDKLPTFDFENSQTFFDIQIGNEEDEVKEKGRVIFELFTKLVPKTAENFRSICAGDKGPFFHYKENVFHRIIKGFMAQGGDTTNQNGTGGKSIYGEKFEDEQIWFPHTHKGVLSMANSGPNTNGSQFFICFGPTPHLNQKHQIYGRVISGYDFVEKMENNPTGSQDKPLKEIRIVDSGELLGGDKLEASQAEFLPSYVDVPMNLTDYHMKEHEDDSGDNDGEDDEDQLTEKEKQKKENEELDKKKQKEESQKLQELAKELAKKQ